MEQIKKRELERKIKSVLSNMPVFVGDYLRRINGYSTTSKIEYLYDLGLFLNYLVKEEIDFIDKNIKDLTYDDLNRINLNHIEGFLEYIVAYEIRVIDEKTGKEKIIEKRNGDAGIHRRASSLRSFFSNLYIISLSKDESDDNRLKKNIAQLIKLNKVKRKQKHIMSYYELQELINVIKDGKGREGEFTEKHKNYLNNCKTRDLCIVTLLMETGIRVTELISIDLDDIDFEQKTIKVTRKGGNEQNIFYNISEPILVEYYEERKRITAKSKFDEKALFLSLQRKRIGARSVQLLLKKYSTIFTNHKITPHTLRRSFATNLYDEIRDINLVALLLGDTVAVASEVYVQADKKALRNAVDNYLDDKIKL